MEKRLRRARTVAIVLAVLFYLVSKIGCAWTEDGNPSIQTDYGAWHLPSALIPTVANLFLTLMEVFSYATPESAVRLTLQLGGLGLALIFALVAYITNAMLRVDAD